MRGFKCTKCEFLHIKVRYCAKRDENKVLVDQWLACTCERCSFKWDEPVSSETSKEAQCTSSSQATEMTASP